IDRQYVVTLASVGDCTVKLRLRWTAIQRRTGKFYILWYATGKLIGQRPFLYPFKDINRPSIGRRKPLRCSDALSQSLTKLAKIVLTRSSVSRSASGLACRK